MVKQKSKIDTYSYKGWLNSDKFLKRAFAVLGYQTLAALIIYLLLLAVFIIIAFISYLFK